MTNNIGIMLMSTPHVVSCRNDEEIRGAAAAVDQSSGRRPLLAPDGESPANRWCTFLDMLKALNPQFLRTLFLIIGDGARLDGADTAIARAASSFERMADETSWEDPRRPVISSLAVGLRQENLSPSAKTPGRGPEIYKGAARAAREVGLVVTADLLDEMGATADHATIAKLRKEAEGYVVRETKRLLLIPVDGNAQRFLVNDLLGASVARALPLAADDTEHAGECLAVGLHTAAVFHLMRVRSAHFARWRRSSACLIQSQAIATGARCSKRSMTPSRHGSGARAKSSPTEQPPVFSKA
jgi:hypothetical protein